MGNTHKETNVLLGSVDKGWSDELPVTQRDWGWSSSMLVLCKLRMETKYMFEDISTNGKTSMDQAVLVQERKRSRRNSVESKDGCPLWEKKMREHMVQDKGTCETGAKEETMLYKLGKWGERWKEEHRWYMRIKIRVRREWGSEKDKNSV